MRKPLGNSSPGIRASLRTPFLTAVSAFALCSSASAFEQTYQYFRFVPTQLGGQTIIQLSEFRFYNGATALPMAGVGVTNSSGTSPGAEGPEKVADGDTGTKWLNFTATGGLVFDFGAPVTVDGYDWATANDALGRSPVSWTMEGSTDGVTWDLIDVVKNNPIPGALFTYTPEILLQPVVIGSFTANNAGVDIVLNGSFVDLAWSTALATDVSIEPGGLTGLGADGFESVTPPSNADTTYTLTASNVDGTADASVIVRSVAGGTENYQYVRFTPTKLRNNGAANSIQLSELRFLDGLTPLAPVAVTNPEGSNPGNGNEGPDKLNDDDTGTKWLDFNKSYLIYDFGAPVDFDGYYLATGGDAPERDPVQWIMEGSNDEVSWTLIENVTAFDYPIPLARQSYSADIPLPGASIKPFANLIGDAPKLVDGEPLVLTWDTVAADTVTISPDVVGPLAASGSTSVSPLVDTTYTLTATSLGGTVTTTTFDVEIVDPAITTIAYADFNAAGDELALLQGSTVLNDFANIPAPGDTNRLRLTADAGGQVGTAWFRKRVDTSAGFSTTFSTQFITLNPGSNGADGMAFILQNTPNGTARTPVAGAEDGVATNALNVKFDSYLNGGIDPSAANIQVRAGTTVLATVDLNTLPNVVPLPGTDPTDLTMNSGDTAPYLIRIDYAPGVPNDLDVYFNNALVIDSLDVDLVAIGAVDGSGTGYVGFSARTGGQFETHDITSWFFTEGPPPAAPVSPGAFAIKDFSFDFGTDMLQVTWGSNELKSYKITASTDGLDWTTELGFDIPGTAAAGETTATVPFTEDPSRLLIRVEEE